MSVWSEIRPPDRSLASPVSRRDRLLAATRAVVHASPLIASLAAALIGLAVLADRGADAPVPHHVSDAAIPASVSPAPLIDINTASVAELATLPGIGETRARAIVELRAKRSVASLADLAERGLLTPAELAQIADLATVYVTIE